MLPNDIWEEVLKHLDVFDLLRLRRVSKRFLCVIDGVIHREGKWYEKCLEEVPKKYWTSILEHHTNLELYDCEFYKSKSHSSIWIKMYKSWIGWNNLFDKMTRQKTIDLTEHISQFINCLSVSSNIIAIGTCRDGDWHFLIVYDIRQFDEGPIYEGNNDNCSSSLKIKDIQVQRKDKHIKVISCNSLGVLQWNVVPFLDSAKLQVNAISGSALISSSLGYSYMLDYGNEQYPCTLRIQQPPNGDSRIIRWSKSDNSRCDAIGADGDKVIVLSTDKTYGHLIIDEITAKSGKLRNISKIDRISELMGYSKIFKPCVVVSFKHDTSDIGFSVAGRQLKKYNGVRDLKLNSAIKSFYYHIGLLIFGLESGDICMIDVKDADQLENLNLETMQYKMLALDNGPIHHVAVTEYNSVQYIVAATAKNLHLVEFY